MNVKYKYMYIAPILTRFYGVYIYNGKNGNTMNYVFFSENIAPPIPMDYHHFPF
jgi:hypothetical protein